LSSMFEGLYIARSGVRASRAALNITGQNITNSNTEGYTRQRVDQSSLPPSDSGSQWASLGAAVGTGTSVDSISQLRDAFLDAEFRTQNAKSGESARWVDTLYDMEDIFTTTTTASSSSNASVVDVLSNQLSNFLTQLQNITSSNSNVAESNLREAAKSLATQLNTAARALNTVREQQYNNLEEYNVKTVNDLLKNIASLDKRIKDAELSGSTVLELKDQQNLLLDKLSKYVSIKVVQEPTLMDNGKSIDTTKVYLADTNGNKLPGNYVLIGGADGSDYAQFTITQDAPEAGKSFGITQLHLTELSVNGTIPTDASGDPKLQAMTNDDIKAGAFAGSLALLNDSGEYDADAGSPRGIGFYSQYLDTIAKQLASTLNGLNYNPNKKDSAGNAVPAEKQILFSGSVETPQAGHTGEDALNDITAGITAENIHVASTWEDGVLTTNKDAANSGDDNSGAFPNILNMIATLKDTKVNLVTGTGAVIFNGTLQKAFASVSSMLALNTNSMQTIDNTNSSLLSNIDNSRQELSSVSLDDEAISITQYTQSLNASSRFMTAVDECLQTIINNMGLAGRG
jgi:flagellar hook-associated protein 1 FlgK